MCAQLMVSFPSHWGKSHRTDQDPFTLRHKPVDVDSLVTPRGTDSESLANHKHIVGQPIHLDYLICHKDKERPISPFFF